MTSKEQLIEAFKTIERTLEYDCDKELTILYDFIKQQTNQPTLSECIKEWEEEGFEVRENSLHYLFLINYDKNINILFRKFELSYKVEDFYDDEDSLVVSFVLHNLIHKTLKALEEMKDGK